MFENPSLITRIGIAKGAGLAFGLIGFFLLPYYMPDVSLFIRWGVLLWYTTFGAIIGVFGVITWHPVLKLPMPWWFRAPLVGGWLNFVLVFFTFEKLENFMLAVFGEQGLLMSPFWVVLEGAVIGLVIGYLATRFGGEGAVLLEGQA